MKISSGISVDPSSSTLVGVPDQIKNYELSLMISWLTKAYNQTRRKYYDLPKGVRAGGS